MLASLSFLVIAGLTPAGSFDNFSNAQLYIRGLNIDSSWDAAAHGFVGMLTYSPEAFRVEYSPPDSSDPEVKFFILGLGSEETLIKTQKDPNGAVGFGGIASPDRTFASGTVNLNHGDMPSSAWIWDKSNGYRYLYDALSGETSIPPRGLGGILSRQHRLDVFRRTLPERKCVSCGCPVLP